MCIFEDLSALQPSIEPVVIEYEVYICKQEEYIKVDAVSAQVSSLNLTSSPPPPDRQLTLHIHL